MSAAFDLLEPVLAAEEIQGNILGGFNKDHQAVLPLRFEGTAAALPAVRAWLAETLPSLTWLREVVTYKRRRQKAMAETGREPTDMQVIWRSLSFSYQGLRKLTPQADSFEPIFRDGLSLAASFRLGDPETPGQEGHPSTWVIGRPGEVPDMLMIVAGDDLEMLTAEVDRCLKQASAAGITCPFVELGHDPSKHPGGAAGFGSGKEHFGFRDGVSQPGVRGRMSDAESDFLTPRLLPDTGDPSSTQPQFSAPGQPLVCAGEFVLGYARQNASFGRRTSPPWKLGPEPFAPDPTAVAPSWAKNGSFLVFRRLRQDVAAFNRFLQSEAARLAQAPEFASLTADTLGAMLVGRWHGGAPFLRSPAGDSPTLGAAEGANNAFAFLNGQDPHDGFPPALGDPLGRVCPQSAHIRKVNPRDVPSDQGPPNTTLVHRILRRGIPFGPPLPVGSTSDPSGQQRGLLFLAFQASIREQFEFLGGTWMNDRSKPSPFSPPGGSGFDMVVGQNPDTSEDRARFCLLGPTNARTSTAGLAPSQWVIPTGGGYFFTPSRTAIKQVLA
jgi:Dyp-type peroxidase family